jgi:hypothetical protein
MIRCVVISSHTMCYVSTVHPIVSRAPRDLYRPIRNEQITVSWLAFTKTETCLVEAGHAHLRERNSPSGVGWAMSDGPQAQPWNRRVSLSRRSRPCDSCATRSHRWQPRKNMERSK